MAICLSKGDQHHQHRGGDGPITDIQQLVFYSWWSEDCESADLGLRISCDSIVGGGIKKRYATVTYDLASKSFSLLSSQDGQDVVLGPAELQKYKPRAHKACVSHDKGQGPLGGLCLSHTVKQLHVLLDDVAQYRPSVATQLREQISILV
ncbi:WW domain-containing protein [Haematococcus lacustris]|uniref:WW domain-containing protein n=1 Tax=Haematococcus lacustris TaxID=44745 RepID=A0A699YY06_HAELA|nr:WW domain-containing protein [Haematococcus lacustris]